MLLVAVNGMILEAEQFIRNEGFGGKFLVSVPGRAWTQAQLWKTIKLLVQHKRLSYDELLFSGRNLNLSALQIGRLTTFLFGGMM
jgi:hypothetical protein